MWTLLLRCGQCRRFFSGVVGVDASSPQHYSGIGRRGGEGSTEAAVEMVVKEAEVERRKAEEMKKKELNGKDQIIFARNGRIAELETVNEEIMSAVRDVGLLLAAVSLDGMKSLARSAADIQSLQRKITQLEGEKQTAERVLQELKQQSDKNKESFEAEINERITASEDIQVALQSAASVVNPEGIEPSTAQDAIAVLQNRYSSLLTTSTGHEQKVTELEKALQSTKLDQERKLKAVGDRNWQLIQDKTNLITEKARLQRDAASWQEVKSNPAGAKVPLSSYITVLEQHQAAVQVAMIRSGTEAALTRPIASVIPLIHPRITSKLPTIPSLIARAYPVTPDLDVFDAGKILKSLTLLLQHKLAPNVRKDVMARIKQVLVLSVDKYVGFSGEELRRKDLLEVEKICMMGLGEAFAGAAVAVWKAER